MKFLYISTISWAKRLRLGARGKIPLDCCQHMCMSVQVTLAITCAAALKFVEDRKLLDSTLMFTIMWKGFYLIRMKLPEELVNNDLLEMVAGRFHQSVQGIL